MMRPHAHGPSDLAWPLSGGACLARISAMTLCLSAICERGNAIVSVFDKRAT